MCYERGVFVVDLVDGGMYACQYVHMSVGAILARTLSMAHVLLSLYSCIHVCVCGVGGEGGES